MIDADRMEQIIKTFLIDTGGGDDSLMAVETFRIFTKVMKVLEEHSEANGGVTPIGMAGALKCVIDFLDLHWKEDNFKETMRKTFDLPALKFVERIAGE